MLSQFVKTVLPPPLYRAVADWVHRPSTVRWGDLRRLEPVSRRFGFDRGQPIDRYYIEQFLDRHQDDIRGRVLEIGDRTYTTQFGGDRVIQSDVLHAADAHPQSTLAGDLVTGRGIPEAAFDCLVLTQTLPFVYDIEAAVRTCCRALVPGGVVLATFAGISQISRFDMDRWGDYWRLTSLSAARLFGQVFGPERVTVNPHGNVLAAVALLQGLASHELSPRERDTNDRDYEVLITVRATRKTDNGAEGGST